METGTFLKVANEVIQLYRASDRWADLCVDEWYHLQLIKTYLSPFKWLELSVIYQPNLTSLVSKWRRHPPASYDMLLIGLIWNISGKMWLLEDPGTFLLSVYFIIIGLV